MEFTGEPSGSHSGLTMKPILWDLNLPPPETFESNLAVNDHPEPLETRKRTWDDMTAESSSAHVEPAPQIRNNMIDVSKHPRSAISEDEVRACCEKTTKNLGRWNAKFSKTSLSTAQLSELSDKMKDVQKAVKNLFEIRILELRGEYLQPEVIKEDSPLKPSELVAGKTQGLLESFSQVGEIRNVLLIRGKLQEKRGSKPNKIIERGDSLMIKLLIDLKELQIVSDKDLAFLLNTNENAKLILARNISNFSKSDLYVIFCYFDEIKKIPSINPQMAGLLNLLNEDTWKQIKFNFLKNQLMELIPRMRQKLTELDEIVSCVLERDELIASYFHGRVERTKQEKIDNEEMLDSCVLQPCNLQHTSRKTKKLYQRYNDIKERKITLYQLCDLAQRTGNFYPEKKSFYKFFRCSEEQLQKIESIQEEIREEIKISRKPRFCRTWTWR
ncbi:hypothetical protein PCANC_10387 [Puccinia coronata f. sp. avenae]|nr:hypothetical protein PCANC_10387 [Puccinia coronata f. sp. avenae]